MNCWSMEGTENRQTRRGTCDGWKTVETRPNTAYCFLFFMHTIHVMCKFNQTEIGQSRLRDLQIDRKADKKGISAE